MIEKIIVASSLEEATEIANKYKGTFNVVAIEAEWGDLALEEPYVDLSINHHGARANNPCPAEIGLERDVNYHNKNNVYILSHLDADTLFGIMWVEGMLNKNTETRNLCEIIAFSDKKGYHKAKDKYRDIKNTNLGRKWLTLGYLFSRNTKVSPGDVTDKVRLILEAAVKIIEHDSVKDLTIYKEASKWSSKKQKNVLEALDYEGEKILGFVGKLFYCDNYSLLDKTREFIVQYDTQLQTILFSSIDEATAKKYFGEKGVVSVLQEYFGDEAGGHVAIGGSPRNKKLSQKEYVDFINFVETKIKG